MNIKEIIKITGLTNRDFARTYGIPIRTVQNWVLYENGNKKEGRKIPSYVKELLEFRVIKDLSM